MKIINFPISQLIEFPLKNINIYIFRTYNQITFNDNIMKHYSCSLRSIMKIVKKNKTRNINQRKTNKP